MVKNKSHLLDTVKYLTGGIVGGQPLPVRTFEEKKQSHKPLDQEEILAKAKKRLQEKNEMSQCETEEDRLAAVASKLFSNDEIKKGISWWRLFSILMFIV